MSEFWCGCVVTVDNECTYNDPHAIHYVGKKQWNEDNVTCIMWSDQRAYLAADFPDDDLLSAENFCRNPKPGYSRAWCYVSEDAARQWGFCALSQCGMFEMFHVVVTCFLHVTVNISQHYML